MSWLSSGLKKVFGNDGYQAIKTAAQPVLSTVATLVPGASTAVKAVRSAYDSIKSVQAVIDSRKTEIQNQHASNVPSGAPVVPTQTASAPRSLDDLQSNIYTGVPKQVGAPVQQLSGVGTGEPMKMDPNQVFFWGMITVILLGLAAGYAGSR